MQSIRANLFNLKLCCNASRHLYSSQHSATTTNEVGVQMINEKFRSLIFYETKKKPNEKCVQEAREHLKQHELNTDAIDLMKEVDHLEIPRLNGNNIAQHFELIGQEQSKVTSLFFSIPFLMRRLAFHLENQIVSLKDDRLKLR